VIYLHALRLRFHCSLDVQAYPLVPMRPIVQEFRTSDTLTAWDESKSTCTPPYVPQKRSTIAALSEVPFRIMVDGQSDDGAPWASDRKCQTQGSEDRTLNTDSRFVFPDGRAYLRSTSARPQPRSSSRQHREYSESLWLGGPQAQWHTASRPNTHTHARSRLTSARLRLFELDERMPVTRGSASPTVPHSAATEGFDIAKYYKRNMQKVGLLDGVDCSHAHVEELDRLVNMRSSTRGTLYMCKHTQQLRTQELF
jgi:hypothetical protein